MDTLILPSDYQQEVGFVNFSIRNMRPYLFSSELSARTPRVQSLYSPSRLKYSSQAHHPWKHIVSSYILESSELKSSPEELVSLIRAKREKVMNDFFLLLEQDAEESVGGVLNVKEWELVVLTGWWLREMACWDQLRVPFCKKGPFVDTGPIGDSEGISCYIDGTYFFRRVQSERLPNATAEAK